MRALPLTACLLLTGAAAQTCGTAEGFPGWVQEGVYTGTIKTGTVKTGSGAGQTIWLNLSLRAPEETRLFYDRVGVDLALQARRDGARLALQESVRREEGGRRVTGCLTLGADLRGDWRSPDGRVRWAVTLRRVDVAALPLKLPASPGLRRLRSLNPLAFVKLNRPWVKLAGGQRVREPFSGQTYPRLPADGAALNAALQDRQLEHAVSALACRADLPDPSPAAGGYEVSAAITFQSPRLLSLREDVSYFCGGAYASGYTEGVILERRTGRRLWATDLWPALTPARQKERYLPLALPRLSPECREVVREMDAAFSAHLGPQGLTLVPSTLPHVAAACAEPVTLGYAALRPLLPASSPYRTDLGGQK